MWRMRRTRDAFGLVRRAVQAVQSRFRRWKAGSDFHRAARTLRRLHAVAIGYIMRRELLKRWGAVVRLQRAARQFLRRLNRYWSNMHGAILLQAAWRGYRFRTANRGLVRLVRKRVLARLVVGRVIKLQALARGRAVREAFLALRRAASRVQQWFKG